MKLPAFLEKSSSVYVVHMDSTSKIISYNASFEKKIGSPRKNLKGKFFLDSISNNDAPLLLKTLKACASNGNSRLELVMKDGRLKDVGVSWEFIPGEAGIIVCIGHDCKDQGSNESLLANEVINSLPGIFYLQDESGKYLRWNKNFETVSGYTEAEIPFLNPFTFFGEKDHPVIQNAIQKVFTEGYAEVEANVVTKDKRVIPYFFNGRMIYHQEKKCLIGTGVDISEKIKNEYEILESEKKYHALFEQASDPIMVTDFKGNFIDVNSVVCNLFGYTKSELKNMHVSALIDPADLNALPIRFDLLAQGQHVFSKRRMVHKNGTVIYVEANVKKLDNNLVMAIARNVTELHKVQRQVEVSEATFRGAFENSPIGMALQSPKGDCLQVNKALSRITGYSEKEMLGSCFSSITHPDDMAYSDDYMQQSIAGKASIFLTEQRYIHKNGSVVWVTLNRTLVRDGNNNPLYFISQVEDITERKKAAEEKDRISQMLNERVKELTTLYRFGKLLQESELSIPELLVKLVSVLPGGWQYPEITAARIVFQNEEFTTPNYKKSHYKQQAFFKTPGGIKVMMEVVYLQKKKSIDEGPFITEERNLIEMLAEMFRVYLIRKEESGALKKSEANLHTIFDATDSIYVLLDKQFRIIYYNNPAVAFAKREMNLAIKPNTPITKYVPANRRGYLLKQMKKALAGEHVSYEVMYNQEDGTKKWYDTRILNISGTEGQVFGIVVAVLDITENKLLENRILEQKVQEQKKMSRAIIRAQEKERNYLGQELHDNVGQLLAGTKLYLKAAGDGHVEVKKLVRYPMQLLDNCIQEIRQLSSRQVTPIKNIRLKKLLHNLLQNWKKNTGTKIKFVFNTGRQTLHDDLKLNIYRIIQEQLNNISKYANATNVMISVLADKNRLTVRVTDDGIGFNSSKKRKGIGISNMINRASAFNGEFSIESAAGKGCKIQVTVPLNAGSNG